MANNFSLVVMRQLSSSQAPQCPGSPVIKTQDVNTAGNVHTAGPPPPPPPSAGTWEFRLRQQISIEIVIVCIRDDLSSTQKDLLIKIVSSGADMLC